MAPARRLLYIDTRQQKGKHAHVDRWLEAHGVAYEYRKLDYGDYMVDGVPISIDTKRDVQELAGNLGHDHARFRREVERANEHGCRLIVLVEEHPEYERRALLGAWRNRVCLRCRKCDPLRQGRCLRNPARPTGKPRQGPWLVAVLDTMERKYGVEFRFCRRADTARTICETLGVEYDGGREGGV